MLETLKKKEPITARIRDLRELTLTMQQAFSIKMDPWVINVQLSCESLELSPCHLWHHILDQVYNMHQKDWVQAAQLLATKELPVMRITSISN